MQRTEIDGMKQYKATIQDEQGQPMSQTVFSDWFADDAAAQVGFREIMQEQGYSVASVAIAFPVSVVTIKANTPPAEARPTVEAEAARIIAELSPADVAYAISPERGEFRGFAALHDRFDANDLLPQGLEVNRPEVIAYLDAIMAEVTRRLCETTAPAPEKSARETALENALRRLLKIAVWDEDFDAADRAEFDAAHAEGTAILAGTTPAACNSIPLPALAMECAGYVNDDARWTTVRAILRAAYTTIPGFTPERAADFARLAGLPEHFKSERRNVFPYAE